MYIKKILKISFFAATSLILLGLVFYLSLFFAWGGIITVEIGMFIAILVAVVFFTVNIIKITDKEQITVEKENQSFLRKVSKILIFILPFYILFSIFMPILLKWIWTTQ